MTGAHAPHGRPLEGVRVLEFAQLFPGPYAALTLAELGAEVIKVEPPGGDPARFVPPMLGAGGDQDVGAIFAALNRGKRSVVLDLKADDGADRDRFHHLARTCRIVIDGYRPGVAERLGVGFDELARGRDDLVHVSISGYGPGGEMAEHAGHDVTYQAWMGALDGRGPALPHVPAADASGSLWAALLALAHLQAPGSHQLAVSLAGSMAPVLFMDAAITAGGSAFHPLRDGLPGYNVYLCSDGALLAVAALEPKFYETLCDLLDDEELLELGHPLAERPHAAVERMAAHFLAQPRDRWVTLLRGAGIPVAPVRSLGAAMHHLGVAGSWDPPSVRSAADLGPVPVLGGHTEAVLGAL